MEISIARPGRRPRAYRSGGRRGLSGTILLVAAVTAASACGADDGARSQAAAEPSNPAQAWHDSVMAAMGGHQGWESARYIAFRWNVLRDGQVVSDRRHDWDRFSGDYRLQSTTQSGEMLVALFNVNSRQGQAWLNGERVEGARADSLVERAYGAFINDTYWLLMPYKWRDPGVHADYQGMVEDDEGAWHVVHLAFDSVGLTPGDQYWAYVDDEPPHLMRKWQYHLQSQAEKGQMIRWENWQRFGPLMLATDRVPADGGGFRIRFSEIAVSESAPPGVFRPPSGG